MLVERCAVEAVAHQTDELKFVRKLNLGQAIAATLRLRSVGYENATTSGERLIWLDRAVVETRAVGGPG